jgi:hypothetical protein
MGKHQHGQLPADLARGRGQFQAWRGRCGGRGRIPQALWAVALRLAKTHGVARTAEVLGLDFDRLKTRVQEGGDLPRSCRPAFIELPSPIGDKSGLFEFDNGDGVTLRVHLVGYDAADVEALARGFWGNR